MQKLILLFWGTVFLMYLSQVNYPVEAQLHSHHSSRHHFMWKKSDVFMVIVILWLTAFSFLRYSYNDTVNYVIMFNNAPTTWEFLAENGWFQLGGNYLSYLYQSVVHDLTDNIHIYFFFPALLSSYAVVKFFKRYSVSPAFSLLIFFSLGTYIMYVAALKQSIAMFFVLLGIPYLEDRKYGPYYLCVIIAMMFHTHAFMFLFVPLLCGKPWSKRMWILVGAVCFAMLTYDSTLGAFMRFADSIGAFVTEIEVFDGHAINAIRVAVYWFPAIIALVFRRRLFSDSTRTENLLMNLSCMSAFILTIGLVEGANLYARMAGYFEIFTAISLPWMIEKLFTRRSVKLVNGCAYVLYFVYFYYEFTVSKAFDTDYAAITFWQFIKTLFS